MPWDKSQAPPAAIFNERPKGAFPALRVASPHNANKGIGHAWRQAASTADASIHTGGRRLPSLRRPTSYLPAEFGRLLTPYWCSFAAQKQTKVSAMIGGKPPTSPISLTLTGAGKTFAYLPPPLNTSRHFPIRSLRSLPVRWRAAGSTRKAKYSPNAPYINSGVCKADGGHVN